MKRSGEPTLRRGAEHVLTPISRLGMAEGVRHTFLPRGGRRHHVMAID